MKNPLILMLILFFVTYSNLYTVEEYLNLLKFDESRNSIICLAEIQQLTTTEILNSCSKMKGNCYPAINIKIIKLYNRDSNLLNNQMNIAFEVDLLTSEINNNRIKQNDLDKEIVFNKKVILSIRPSDCFECEYSIANIGIAFYIDKEPGKSLYKYLEKKYKTKEKKSK